jgi:protein-disulfide isomerase
LRYPKRLRRRWAAESATDQKAESATDQKLDEVLAELREIRSMLKGNGRADVTPMAQHATIDIDGAVRIGAADAPVTIVEFMDFQCSYCKDFYAKTFTDLRKLFIDTGKIKFYIVDLPLPSQAEALNAAQTARCASDQGKYWAIVDKLESDQSVPNADTLARIQAEAGVDASLIADCVKEERYKKAIQLRAEQAVKSGIRGTSAFLVGRSNGSVVDGQVVIGAVPLGVLQAKIEQLK